MDERVMDILSAETGGISYKAHKYALDHAERPTIDYGEEHHVWKKCGESTPRNSYVDLDRLSRDVAHSGSQMLTYFLDGSRRVYKVDDISYAMSGTRTAIYPVIAGQIVVGCCKRINKIMTRYKYVHELAVALPDIADKDGNKAGFWSAIAKKLNASSILRRLSPDGKIAFGPAMTYQTASVDQKQYEDKGTECIQDRMITIEQDMVASLVAEEKIDQENYLVKDGSLEYRNVEKLKGQALVNFKKKYNYVIGISKSFNPHACKDTKGKANPGFIADLQLYHRAPVAWYEAHGMKFAVWYIRLRDKSSTKTPFDGIVKVEKMLVNRDELNDERGMDSELVDLLSAYIINERNPVCYGMDSRWANHIYPVFATEQFVKSKYLGTECFLHLF